MVEVEIIQTMKKLNKYHKKYKLDVSFIHLAIVLKSCKMIMYKSL